MLKSYFKAGWRTLSRNKLFSLIKILGLSIGLTACILILLFTMDELSFDRFQKNKDHIFRIYQSWKMGSDPAQMLGITNAILGEAFARSIPQVRQYVRVNSYQATVKTTTGVFNEQPICVDSNFFEVFTFPLVSGNSHSALKDPHSIVLSEKAAKKYFGTANPMGRIMQLKLNDRFENFRVTGIAENPPANSSIQFDLLLPFADFEQLNRNDSWIGGSLTTFLLLSPSASPAKVVQQMRAIFDAQTRSEIQQAEAQQGISMKIILGLQPFTQMHLGQIGLDNGLQYQSSPVYSYILSSIALFILLIACINFINMAIGQSLKRAKEIGIRKVVGSTRGQLVRQFLTESFIVSVIAFLLALILTVIALPFFNALTNEKISLSYLPDGYLLATFLLLLAGTSLLAGLYPSLVLARFNPVTVLYGRNRLAGKNYFTRILVAFQFTLAIFLVICSVTVNRQMRFLLHTNPGYDAQNLVRIGLPPSQTDNSGLAEQLRTRLNSNGSVTGVTLKSGGRSIMGVKVNGKMLATEFVKVDGSFLPIFKIPVLAGRNFSGEFPSDARGGVMVNQSFVKAAGWTLQNAPGQVFRYGDTDIRLTVVGVFRDYHFASMKEKITPEILVMDSSLRYGEAWVKISPADIPRTMAFLETTFHSLVPFYPYEYQFMNDINASNYLDEENWMRIINLASIMFIFISCMGLLGLVILSIEIRTKEIGIRKVLGAAVSGIVLLASREFILLVALGFLLAIPLGYVAMEKWLQNFAYHIPLGWWIFPLSGILVAILAMLSMALQTIRAAIANPVKSLRTE